MDPAVLAASVPVAALFAVLGADALEELGQQTIDCAAKADETWKQPSPVV